MRHVIAPTCLSTCLSTCLKQRHDKKSMPCLIEKASRCVADSTSKTTMLLSFTFHITERSFEKIMGIVVSLVHWSKLYYIYIFFTQRMTDFNRLKRNMNCFTTVLWNNCFSDVFTYCLNLKHFSSLFFLMQDNFMF